MDGAKREDALRKWNDLYGVAKWCDDGETWIDLTLDDGRVFRVHEDGHEEELGGERSYEFDVTLKVVVPDALSDADVEQVKAALGNQVSLFAVGLRPLGRGKGYGVYVTADRDSVLVQEVHRTASGKALRDADFEALADEAEKGYDVSHLRAGTVRSDVIAQHGGRLDPEYYFDRGLVDRGDQQQEDH